MGEFKRELLPDPVSLFEAEGLTLSGRGVWRTTRCDFHGGSDSMRVKTSNGAWRCMACDAKGGDVVDFVMQRGTKLTAIEVKSGKVRAALPGMAAFHDAFKPSRALLIGEGGIDLETFLMKPASVVLA